MPQLKINQQNFPIQQIREIKADQDLNKLRSELAGNGLDEVWFEAKGKHFLAIGESLNLSNLKSQSSLHVELNGEWIDAKVLGSQDDISSWSEGWAKGSSLGKSISLAWQGAQSKVDWQAIHGWSVGISVWPKQEPKTPAPVQTVPITVQTTVPTPQDTTSVSPPVIPEPDLDPALQKPRPLPRVHRQREIPQAHPHPRRDRPLLPDPRPSRLHRVRYRSQAEVGCRQAADHRRRRGQQADGVPSARVVETVSRLARYKTAASRKCMAAGVLW